MGEICSLGCFFKVWDDGFFLDWFGGEDEGMVRKSERKGNQKRNGDRSIFINSIDMA